MFKSKLVKTSVIAGVLAVGLSTSAFSAGITFNTGEAKPNSFWWPEELKLNALRAHSTESNPYGEGFNYAEEFKKLDLDAVKEDLKVTLKTSQDWWPADYGHYGPFFIRMAWHSAGTYRTHDGRGGAGGGQQRFNPLNSWPDNGNLDKARRLLWPIKQKYGKQLSWADLMVLAGTVAMEDMGFKTMGFAGGRADDWEPDLVYWGPEKKMLDMKRRGKDGKLEKPLAAVQMGLIYVNPEGPGGNHDPISAAADIRESFGRMAMNDEEIVALIAGGHTFGKAHGAHKAEECLDVAPGSAAVEEQGFGWKNKCGKGHSEDTVTSGLEGAWTSAPAQWTSMYLDNLFNFEWKQEKSPAGAVQWVPTDESAREMVPDAHIEGKFHAPIMFTTDLSLKEDPKFRAIAKRFQENTEEFEKAFAQAWFKLTHRDMGPKARYLGSDVPEKDFLWQDPIPEIDYNLVTDADVRNLKEDILASGLTKAELVKTAWAAASSFRASDMRGGANGGRLRLEPQVSWEVNDPESLSKVLTKLEEIQEDFHNRFFGKTKISMADLIVLGGAAAIEQAAADAGYRVEVPFVAGRADASQAQTSVQSFNYLKPTADAFRNFYSEESYMSPTDMMVDKAAQLNLTVPEMTVLIGGMRVLGANTGDVKHGVLTDNVGQLSNDFFVNLLSMDNMWSKAETAGLYEAHNRKTGEPKWTATPVDLIFGSSSELRAVAEVYASKDAERKFVDDFVKAWVKVMQLDRFDLKHNI